jgi:hypothetical protein
VARTPTGVEVTYSIAEMHQVYDGLEQVRQAHTDMETNAANSTLTLSTPRAPGRMLKIN